MIIYYIFEFFNGIKKLWIRVFNSVTCALSDSTISMTTTARLALNCSVKSTGTVGTLFAMISPKTTINIISKFN